MTKEEKEVMKMGLEALERNDYLGWQVNKPVITAIKKCLANDALEKKAENARKLGLEY